MLDDLEKQKEVCLRRNADAAENDEQCRSAAAPEKVSSSRFSELDEWILSAGAAIRLLGNDLNISDHDMARLPQINYLNRGQMISFPPLFQLRRYELQNSPISSDILKIITYLRSVKPGEPIPSEIR